MYVSSSMVFERAEQFPTPEEYLPRLPDAALRVRLLEAHRRGLLPRGARRARPAVHDLPPVQRLRPGRDARRGAGHRARGAGPDRARCSSGQRPLQIFGSGEQTRTLTHVDDIADGVVTAMSSPAALNEDFNISASRELTRRGDRAHHVGGLRRGPGGRSSSSTCRRSPSTSSGAGRRWRRRGGCSAGRRRSRSRTASRRPCAGCASATARGRGRDAVGARDARRGRRTRRGAHRWRPIGSRAMSDAAQR